MKNLLLLVIIGGAGFFAFQKWTASPEAPDPSLDDQTQGWVEASPVDFSIKMRVKRVLDAWKLEALEIPGRARASSIVSIPGEMAEIRRRLQRDGLHDLRFLRETMVQAAVELGYARDQATLLVDEVLAARRR